jgi:hypothetical protein
MAKRRLSKVDQLERYRKRIEWSKKWRDQEGLDDLWRRLTDLYRGKHFSDSTTEDRIAVNIAFSTLNIIYPSVSINHPKITITANSAEDEDKATITEAVVNYWWRHYDFKSPFRRAVKDSLTMGHGWLKVGYRFVEVDQELDDDERDEMYGQQLDEADSFAEANPEMAHELPTDEEIREALPSTKQVVTEDRPFVERVSPYDMYVDPEATCLEDLRWIAQKIVRDLDEVKNDKRYKEAVRRRVEADSAYYYNDPDRDRKRDSDADRVTVWEFYDLAKETLCVWADGSDDYLVDPRKIPYAFGHPYVFVPNYEVPDEFYPMGDLEQIEDLQGELNKTRSEMMNRRRKDQRKWLFRESGFSPEGRAALESDIDNVLVPVVDETNPLGDLVVPMPQNPMDASLYNYSDQIEQDLDRVSGVNEYARGSIPEIRRTATEAAMIQDAANSRAADKLARVEECISMTARRVTQVAQQFLTGEQVARITNGDKSMWVQFSHDDIEGEFDFTVEGGSTQPMNETARRQQAIAMAQTMGPFIGQVVDPHKIAAHLLRYGFGVTNPEDYMIPPAPPEPPPQQERFQETMNYRDAPPDIRRQMEQAAGYQPSQLGDLMPGPAGSDMGMRETGTDTGTGPEGPPMPPGPPQGGGEPTGPGPEAMGPPDMGQGGLGGADAQQMDPRQLLELQTQGSQDAIPPEVLAQLQAQVGLNIG